MDGIVAMNLSLLEWPRGSAQIAAQSQGIIDLHDNQRLAARISIFGVTCNRAAATNALQLRPATIGASATASPTTIGATTCGAAAAARNSVLHAVIWPSEQRPETRRAR